MIEEHPLGRRPQMAILAGALVLAMAPWFSTAAVLGELRETWQLDRTQASWLTIVVQLGFVVGAVISAATNLADRVAPRRLIFLGAAGAALANASIVVADSYPIALVARFVTGAFLAGVYPPALKAMSAWYRTGRGMALGVMIGALTLGSALPHLVNGLGGLGWKSTLVLVSVMTFIGGLGADRLTKDGPFGVGVADFDPSQIRVILANREFRLASLGYFGHMWELYAMWSWIAAFYGDVFSSSRQASFAAFGAIAAGAAGSVYAGLLSDRRTRAEAAGLAMRWSGALALVTGFLVDAPAVIVVLLGLVWGFWVVADSAQFSTIVTEAVDAKYVGTALTVQLAAGFVLTVFTIFLVPVIRDGPGWGWAFALLAPGPAAGAWAMHRLKSTQVSAPRLITALLLASRREFRPRIPPQWGDGRRHLGYDGCAGGQRRHHGARCRCHRERGQFLAARWRGSGRSNPPRRGALHY